MALAYSIKGRGSSGDMFERVVDITFDNAYPSPGGWSVDPKGCGFGVNGQILFVDMPAAKIGYILEYDAVNNKIKAYQNGAGNSANVELVNNSAVLNAVVARALIMGKGSPG
jgi:hypothetical protein